MRIRPHIATCTRNVLFFSALASLGLLLAPGVAPAQSLSQGERLLEEGNRLLEQAVSDHEVSLAAKKFHEALVIFEALESPAGVGKAANNLGRTYDRRGDYPRAVEYFRKALAGYNQTTRKLSYRMADTARSWYSIP